MSTAAARTAKERLYLFDTTLRDGAQTNGIDFTLHDKQRIAGMLDELGIDYVEGGYPGANPIDTQFFVEERKLGATFTAFGMTRRPGRPASRRYWRRRPTPSALSLSHGTITCASRSRPRPRRTSPRSATACAPPRPR